MPRFILRNPDGTVQLDLSKRVTKFLGSIITGSSGGSISVPGFLEGTPFYFTFPNQNAEAVGAPAVTISGTTLSWLGDVSTSGTRIGYGIY